ncbi:Uma2 family endonuclease [Leptolyngbya sp. AN03gr2]|uniref:Uma2 family endonuclease n=1 Tax=unclassified Leptolyngbya TaxID=2650499 RepID=UPI003D321512
MTQAKPRFATFEEYLEFDDGTDERYELIDGELFALPPESEPNDFIPNLLFLKLAEAGIPPRLIRPHTCEIQVPVLARKDAANRYPDLVVLDPVHLSLTQKRLTILIDAPPPQLVAEVLSPGKANRDRDLIRKRAQYAKRGIPEYWLIDRENQSITALTLEGEEYTEVGVFEDDRTIVSPQFPQLQLTPAQLFEN